MPSTRSSVPAYNRFGKRYARTRINGKETHLGVYNSPESLEKYSELLDQWRKSQCESISDSPQSPKYTVLAVIGLYLSHRDPEREAGSCRLGANTAKPYRKLALQLLADRYGVSLARDFAPITLKAFRLDLAQQGFRRREINDSVALIKGVFEYAAKHGLVEEIQLARLAALKDLRKGELDVRE